MVYGHSGARCDTQRQRRLRRRRRQRRHHDGSLDGLWRSCVCASVCSLNFMALRALNKICCARILRMRPCGRVQKERILRRAFNEGDLYHHVHGIIRETHFRKATRARPLCDSQSCAPYSFEYLHAAIIQCPTIATSSYFTRLTAHQCYAFQVLAAVCVRQTRTHKTATL